MEGTREGGMKWSYLNNHCKEWEYIYLYMDKINKKNGEIVSKGSLLITYKNEEIENQISQIEDQISDLKKGKK